MKNTANNLSLTLNKERATKETQLLMNKSTLERSDEVKAIEEKLKNDPRNSELWMERGKALAKQMLNIEATDSFSKGLAYDPFNWLLLRHRGHRNLSTYRIENAASDLELASRINSEDWDIWYHLGLSYYLMGDFEKALSAYEKCLKMTEENDPNLVGIVNWEYLTLLRLGRKDEALKILELVDKNTDAGENGAYKDMILFYKEDITFDQAMEFENPEYAGLEFSTRGYGIAIHFYCNGMKEKAIELLNELLKDDSYWTAFGYLAAHVEIENQRLV